ncbi:SpvB/TcaC N-terminal domain-containing protein, partial [Marinilabiliaceae bacterium ANBcel2]|nr:SpvB/TcaC N-terminal domain-containing protein [Marinilabiliaceae bacterium ANBcel2]
MRKLLPLFLSISLLILFLDQKNIIASELENSKSFNTITSGINSVGAIPGDFDVSLTGAATYTIPIEVAEGINNMQPNLTLQYNSQGGNSIAGWGWNIGGISSISRVTSNIYYDNEIGTIDWSQDSPLSFDGQRLIKISDNEYRTENESYYKITKVPGNRSESSVIVVETKEGLTIEYGNRDDIYSYTPLETGVMLSWNITRVTDNFGNYIEYNYTGEKEYIQRRIIPERGTRNSTNTSNQEFRDDPFVNREDLIGEEQVMYVNENSYNRIKPIYDDDYINRRGSNTSIAAYKSARIDEIVYGNKNGAIASVSFKYDNREDVIKIYLGGYKYLNNKLLSQIKVYSYGELYRNYRLDYNFEGGYSHLHEVTLYNPSGGYYNPTTINWKDWGNPNSRTGGDQISFINEEITSWPIYGDFTGNGRRDFITYKDGVVKLYKNHELWGDIYFFIEDEFTIYGDDPKGVVPADLNGNGKLDLVSVTEAPNGTYRYNYYFFDGESFSNGGGSGYRGFNTTVEDGDYVIGDFNGDGKHNILIKSTLNVYNEYGSVIGRGGVDNSDTEQWLSTFPDNRFLIDFTGNGKTNICVVSDDQLQVYELIKGSFSLIYTKSGDYKSIMVYPGDYTGCGKTDLLIRRKNDNDDDHYFMLFSSGKSFVKKSLPNLNFSERTFPANFSLDGRTDIVICMPSERENRPRNSSSTKSTRSSRQPEVIKFSIGRFDGTTFNFTDHLSDIPYYTLVDIPSNIRLGFGGDRRPTPRYETIDKHIDFGDYTGDGRMELCYNKYSNAKIIKSFTDKSNLHVKEIRNGLGESIRLDFKPMTSYVYSKSSCSSYNYPLVAPYFPFYLLSNVEYYGGLNRSKSYSYKDLMFHMQGKGFVGFKTIVERAHQNNIETINSYRLDQRYFSLLPENKEVKISGETVSKIDYNYQLIPGKNSRQYITRLNSVIEHDALLNTTVTKSYSNYDQYGNPGTIAVDYGEGISKSRTIEYISSGSWCLNAISQKEVTYYNKHGSSTVKSEYSYFDNGAIRSETESFGSDEEITTAYNYDSFGNVINIKVKSLGSTREKSFEYSMCGNFLESETDINLGKTINYEYDKVTGTLIKKSDNIGSTLYEYDGFNRMISAIYPDGNQTTISREWSHNNGPGLSVYFIQEEHSKKSPVTRWFDSSGRELQKSYFGLNEQKYYITKNYNYKGQLYRVSEPHTGSPMEWLTTYYYDDYGRKESVITPMGVTNYSYTNSTTTKTTPRGTLSTTVNSVGQIIESERNGKKVVYDYYPSGEKKSATPQGGRPVTFKYDGFGNCIELNDPNFGIITNEYDGFGNVISQREVVHEDETEVLTTYDYALSGLLQSKKVSGKESALTEYEYDNKNRLISVSIPGIHSKNYFYDNLSRPVKLIEIINDKEFVFETEYDSYGRVIREIYPSGFFITNEYDKYGYLKAINDKNGRLLYKAKQANNKGQINRYLQGGIETEIDYDPATLLPNQISVGEEVLMTYEYDYRGNLKQRSDLYFDHIEKFTYDNANRLLGHELYRDDLLVESYSLSYDNNSGGITSKPFVEYDMQYENGDHFHALSSVKGISENAIKELQLIEYTDFKKMQSITQGDKSHHLIYGTNQQRIKGTFSESGEVN